jgi:hypothetical protein
VRRTPGRTLRATAALALAGYGVHQARYALVSSPHAETGHAYLHAVAPMLLALLLALALGRSLAGVARAARPAGAPVRWLACSAALLVLHIAQEGAERLLAGGGGLDASTLLAVPLCLAAGMLVAGALRGADELLEAAAAPRARASRARFPASPPVLLPAPPAPARAPALAGHLAGRGPPALG